jgi:uncharacterized RDD family membrane protein YckC
MSSNDPTGGPAPGDPEDELTRADWPVAGQTEGPPPAPSPTHSDATGSPAPPPHPRGIAPALSPGAGYSAGPMAPPGYPPAPGHAPASAYVPAPGMAWTPPADVVGGPGVAGVQYAGALPRFVAWVVDRLIVGFIGWILIAVAIVLFAGSIDWSRFTTPGISRSPIGDSGPLAAGILVAGLIGLLIEVVYFVLLWTSSARATLGMRLLSLQVANAADGTTMTRSQALKRWIALGPWLGVLSSVPAIGFVATLVEIVWSLVILLTTASSPTKQGVHDRAARSLVVQPRGDSSNGLFVGCMVIVAIVLVTPIIGIVALIFLGSQVSGILQNVSKSV